MVIVSLNLCSLAKYNGNNRAYAWGLEPQLTGRFTSCCFLTFTLTPSTTLTKASLMAFIQQAAWCPPPSRTQVHNTSQGIARSLWVRQEHSIRRWPPWQCHPSPALQHITCWSRSHSKGNQRAGWTSCVPVHASSHKAGPWAPMRGYTTLENVLAWGSMTLNSKWEKSIKHRDRLLKKGNSLIFYICILLFEKGGPTFIFTGSWKLFVQVILSIGSNLSFSFQFTYCWRI